MSGDWAGYKKKEASGLYELLDRLGKGKGKIALLKGQVMGPVSLAYALPGETSLREKLEAALKACLRQLEWQAEMLGGVAEHLLFVLDEPSWKPSDGSDEQMFANISDCYSYLYVRLSELGASLGVHSCTAAPPANFFSLPAELYSFDALSIGDEGLQELSGEFKSALARGAVLAPGVFPACVEDGFEQAYRHGLERYRSFVSGLKTTAHLAVLKAANCGHAFAKLAWLETLYRA